MWSQVGRGVELSLQAETVAALLNYSSDFLHKTGSISICHRRWVVHGPLPEDVYTANG